MYGNMPYKEGVYLQSMLGSVYICMGL